MSYLMIYNYFNIDLIKIVLFMTWAKIGITIAFIIRSEY
jgi:hypothetical protein